MKYLLKILAVIALVPVVIVGAALASLILPSMFLFTFCLWSIDFIKEAP